MANDPNNSGDQDSSYLNQDDSEKSLVGKFKSIISNTPLSKWFRRQENDGKSTVRRRDEEGYEEDIDQLQPPAKRAKFTVSKGNDVNVLPIKTSDNLIKDKLISRDYNFPEPVAGPSGLQSRKLLNSVGTPLNSDINVHLLGSEFLNGHKDSDSEESTSGYSSLLRLGSKEHVCQSEGSSKQPSPLQNNSPNRRSLFETPTAENTSRSLFTEITSPHMNTSMSARRPHFNASTFSSPNFIDQTLSTERVISSPFYNGSTIYGGASAYGNKFDRRTKDLKNSLKRSVHIKPIKKNNAGSSLVLGKTARKILETLEQYSTPINDAKKIPVASKRVRLDTGLLGQHVGFKPYGLPSDSASNRELQVPTVSDLLKMKQKAKLQSSTEAVRQIATSSKTDVNILHSKSAKTVTPHVVPQTIVEKPKESTHIGQTQALPSLPVQALPKFDVVVHPTVKKTSEKLPEPTTVTPPPKVINVQKPIIEHTPPKLPNVQSVISGGTKRVTQKEHVTSALFKFSDPLVIAENLKSIIAMNNFKFSEPLSNLNKSEHVVGKQFKEKNNGQTVIKDALPNSSLLDKFKPASGTWECETCLIRNQPDKTKCVACETPKLKPVQADPLPNSYILNKVKPASGTWECSTCLIRNQPDKTKCIACETPKLKPAHTDPLPNLNKFKPPSGTWECNTCLIRNQLDKTKCVACETPKLKPVQNETKKSSFGDNFKMPENMWECPVCMIRNSNDSAKCVACETVNPKTSTVVSSSSSFGKKFQPPSNSWECSTCLIRNKEDVEKCAACETPRLMKKRVTNELVNSFKIKADEWECSVCMVRNKEIHTKCQCCEATKPGSSTFVIQETEKKPVTKFNFGIDKTSAVQFKFGIQPTTTTSAEVVLPETSVAIAKSENLTTPTFSFGVTPVIQKKTDAVEPPKPSENKLTVSANSTTVTAPEKTETVPTSGQNASDITLSKNKDTKNPSTIQTPTIALNAKPAFNVTKDQPQVDKKFQFISPTTNSTVSSSKSDFSFGKSVKPTSSTPTLFSQTKLPSSISGNNGLNAKPITTFGIPSKASGDVSSTKPAEAKPFSFTKPDSNGEPASKAPMFNFGQAATQAVHTATSKTSGFNFGQVAKSPFLNFSAGDKKTEGSTPGTFMFSSSNTEASKNGPFNFGGGSQNTATQKAAFNFGSVATTPASSEFTFDGAPATTQAAPKSGFNFSASFDANTKPTFNFSERSVVTFSAQPSGDGGAAAPRKIKRGVRRTQR